MPGNSRHLSVIGLYNEYTDMPTPLSPRHRTVATGRARPQNRTAMTIDRIRARAVWIEENLLPYERDIRAWLKLHRAVGLEIDDIIQEMYAKIGSLDSFEHIRDPKRYAFQVAYSILLNFVRRSQIVSISAVGDLAELNVPSLEASPEEHALLRDDVREIASAIATLPKRAQQVLMLRRIEGLSQRETATKLSIGEKAVEKHLARAVTMLMDHFGRGGGKGTPQVSHNVEFPSSDNKNDDSAS